MLNKVILIGFVGQEPEIRANANGQEFASFSLATSERWKDRDSGERKDRTEWHRVVVFNEHLVKIVKSYVGKGSKIYLEGQLRSRKWEDKEGIERSQTEIMLKTRGNITLLDKADSSTYRAPDDAYDEE